MSDTPAPDADPSATDGFAAPSVGQAKVLGREPRVVRRRFYKSATVAPGSDGFMVQLDGRNVRTPSKALLVVPVEALARALAGEWAAQGDEIKPSTMPLTTLACTAIDAVAAAMPAVAGDIGRYASSDLLCYRAAGPRELAERQAADWDPVLDWARAELGVPFRVATGIMPVAQPADAATTMVAALAPLDPLRLSAMQVLTALMGSALLAFALLRQRLTLDEAWRLAHLDEQWQIDKWGADAEAGHRQAQRYRDASAAATVLDMLRR